MIYGHVQDATKRNSKFKESISDWVIRTIKSKKTCDRKV